MTVFGFKPVFEALEDTRLILDKLLISKKLKGERIDKLIALAEARGLSYQRVAAEEVSKLSKHPKEDQGLALDVEAKKMQAAESFFQGTVSEHCHILAVDAISTPGNLGLIIRSAVALGIDALLLPRKGTAKLSPLVIKASAGLAFHAPLLKCEHLSDVLPLAQAAGFHIYGMDASGSNLYSSDFAPRSIFIMGNESEGLQNSKSFVQDYLSIPMSSDAESLNVACAASVLLGELARRKLSK